MTNEEFAGRITAAMLAEPAVARVVAMDFPELVDNKRAMDTLVNAVGRPAHPAADLDAPRDAGEASWVTRGFIQVRQADWVRLGDIARVRFETGPGADACTITLRSGDWALLEQQEARDFWVVWTQYLAGDD